MIKQFWLECKMLQWNRLKWCKYCDILSEPRNWDSFNFDLIIHRGYSRQIEVETQCKRRRWCLVRHLPWPWHRENQTTVCCQFCQSQMFKSFQTSVTSVTSVASVSQTLSCDLWRTSHMSCRLQAATQKLQFIQSSSTLAKSVCRNEIEVNPKRTQMTLKWIMCILASCYILLFVFSFIFLQR